MAIQRLGAKEYKRKQLQAKINEIIDWIEQAERCQITPSVGKASLPGSIDLSAFLTRDAARQAGLNVI